MTQEKKSTEMIEAVRLNRRQEIYDLLARGVSPNEKDFLGMTPLTFAANQGDEEVVRLLLAAGANSNDKDKDGVSVLTWAAVAGHSSVMEMLMENGADLDSATIKGETALHRAAGFGKREAALLLVARGASMEARDEQGRTPCDSARYRKFDELAEEMEALEKAMREREWMEKAARGAPEKIRPRL